MMCRDIDTILEKLETNPDIETTRSLLRQADTCATCPEKAHPAVGADECSCQVRFRTELQNSLRSFFGVFSTKTGKKVLKPWVFVRKNSPDAPTKKP